MLKTQQKKHWRPHSTHSIKPNHQILKLTIEFQPQYKTQFTMMLLVLESLFILHPKLLIDSMKNIQVVLLFSLLPKSQLLIKNTLFSGVFCQMLQMLFLLLLLLGDAQLVFTKQSVLPNYKSLIKLLFTSLQVLLSQPVL